MDSVEHSKEAECGMHMIGIDTGLTGAVLDAHGTLEALAAPNAGAEGATRDAPGV